MVSTYKKLKVNNENVSLLNLFAVTGRKHQLRKQLAAIGYPIIGDKKYTKKSQLVTDNVKEKASITCEGYNFSKSNIWQINQCEMSTTCTYEKIFTC